MSLVSLLDASDTRRQIQSSRDIVLQRYIERDKDIKEIKNVERFLLTEAGEIDISWNLCQMHLIPGVRFRVREL